MEDQIRADFADFHRGRRSRFYSVERLWRSSDLDAIYRSFGPCRDSDEFIRKARAVPDIALRLPDNELTRIPAGGCIMMIANHLFGMDGMIRVDLSRCGPYILQHHSGKLATTDYLAPHRQINRAA